MPSRYKNHFFNGAKADNMKRIILQAALYFFCVDVLAQQALTNNGNLQIHSGASITGFGNFTNTSAALLSNAGNLYIKGNLSNGQSSMATGTGTLYLNGALAQAVGGAQTFKTYNLNTDNTAGITLNSNLSVSGVHSLICHAELHGI
jgi:hypothetical protein